MARIRKVEIRNFRSIRYLDWLPSAGINCLIGPGDSGKSTILDAIDLCLGARRNVAIGDTDFHALDVTQPIDITITLGALSDKLKNLDSYGDYLRGFNIVTGQIDDEPLQGLETVLTLKLSVASDLEPVWSLVSLRAQQQGLERGIAWKDRLELAPVRLGNYANANLSWSRGSVLNRLSDERPNLGAELAHAAREARTNFGDQAGGPLAGALKTVTETAKALGISIGAQAKALLDAHSVSIGDGAIALHSDSGIPLRSLGTGSSRLLIAGLQRAAATATSILLADEVEYGLEPHRLTRLLNSIGAKEVVPPLQVFMTTHSPVAVRELNGNQVFVARNVGAGHVVQPVGTADDVQSTIRTDPEAFLARTVIVCEGASEVGFVRGLDEYRVVQGCSSLLAAGVAYVNAGGGDPDKSFMRGNALLSLGYRVIVLIDSDKAPTQEIVGKFLHAGGRYFAWQQPRALEDELFLSLDHQSVQMLIARAIELSGRELIEEHIRSQSQGERSLDQILAEGQTGQYCEATRTLLALTSRNKKNGWFKSVSKFEGVARDIVGPNIAKAAPDFQKVVLALFNYAHAT